jgi:hypothetical protein
MKSFKIVLLNILRKRQTLIKEGQKPFPFYCDCRLGFVIYSGLKFTKKGVFFIGIYDYAPSSKWKEKPKYMDITQEFLSLWENLGFDSSVKAIKSKYKSLKYSNAKFENTAYLLQETTVYHKKNITNY